MNIRTFRNLGFIEAISLLLLPLPSQSQGFITREETADVELAINVSFSAPVLPVLAEISAEVGAAIAKKFPPLAPHLKGFRLVIRNDSNYTLGSGAKRRTLLTCSIKHKGKLDGAMEAMIYCKNYLTERRTEVERRLLAVHPPAPGVRK